jgi:23S rRNA pseudouridine1911/1915/1917 synthase
VKRSFRAAVGDPPQLRALLAARLAISDTDVALLLARGAVELDGQRTTEDAAVHVGARITAFLSDGSPVQAAPLKIVYRDRHVLVVDKPAGLRSQGVRGDDWDTLIARVQRELDPAATLLHRLDRETSGLVLLPRSDRARASLQTALANGEIDRRYAARVAGAITASRSVRLRIAVDPADRRRRITHPEQGSAGDPACTEIEPYASSGNETRVYLRLQSGRTHQIRAHLAAIDHPILGDTIYGGPPSGHLRLHAHALSFPNVSDGTLREVKIRLDPLDD